MYFNHIPHSFANSPRTPFPEPPPNFMFPISYNPLCTMDYIQNIWTILSIYSWGTYMVKLTESTVVMKIDNPPLAASTVNNFSVGDGATLAHPLHVGMLTGLFWCRSYIAKLL